MLMQKELLEKYNGFTIYGAPSEGVPNPRKEYDHLGRMVCMHRRYVLGDVQEYEDPPEGSYVLPIYGYDHGQLTISHTPFSCPWDSGQLGIIYMTPDVIKENCPAGRDWTAWAHSVLLSEIQEYDLYLTGQVFDIWAEDEEGNTVASYSHNYGYMDEEKNEILLELRAELDEIGAASYAI
jgi:hypothetical protein